MVTLDNETKARLADFFESWELVEFLRLPVDDIIEAFPEEILEALDDIEELMGITDGESALLNRLAEE